MAVLDIHRLNELAQYKQYLAFVLCASVLLFIAGRCVYLIYFHPLSNVPGPLQAKLTDWWQMYHAAKLTKATKIQGNMAYNPPIKQQR